MKKGIVLLVSLSFIGIISLLIFENLRDTDILIRETNDDFITTQALISVNNYKNEIGKLLVKNKDDLEDILENELFSNKIPINAGNVEVNINLIKYEEMYDINTFIRGNENEKKELEELFVNNDVDYSSFNYFINNYINSLKKEDKSIKNGKQLDKIIFEFVKETNNDDIKNIRDQLGVIKTTDELNFILCDLDLDINDKKFSSRFIYDLNSSKENDIKVSDFEFIFK